MDRIYYYILAVDNGFAPCVDEGALTLAICKPGIRLHAGKDDWIIGISPKKDGHRLCYVAKITRDPIPGQDYYTKEKFRKRGDRIYRFDGRKFSLRKRRRAHEEGDVEKDVGKFPAYQNAVVLMSSKFWYYGDNARIISHEEYPALNRQLNRLTQGYRVNHPPAVHKELITLIRHVRRRKLGVHGNPRNPPRKESDHSKHTKRHELC
jgi:hypothetical protein